MADAVKRQQPAARAAQRGDKDAEVVPPSFSASYLNNPEPRYPLSARHRGLEGTVILRVLVSADGLPARVIVQTSSGSRILDAAAAEDVQKSWRFVPARRGTQAVEAEVDVPIVFKLKG
jgi:protein TonB